MVVTLDVIGTLVVDVFTGVMDTRLGCIELYLGVYTPCMASCVLVVKSTHRLDGCPALVAVLASTKGNNQ